MGCDGGHTFPTGSTQAGLGGTFFAAFFTAFVGAGAFLGGAFAAGAFRTGGRDAGGGVRGAGAGVGAGDGRGSTTGG